jgi:beta-lactamase class A
VVSNVKRAAMRAAITTIALLLVMAMLPVASALARTPPRPVASSTAALEQQRIDAFWSTGPQQDWYEPRFLQSIPFGMIAPIPKRVTDGLGAYRRTTGSGGRYISEFEKGTVEAHIHINADGKIDNFRLLSPVLTAGGIDTPAKELSALPGNVAYVLIENHKERATQNPNAALAAGSASKLAVLAALRDQIAAGRRHWSDVVPLQENWKSSPSGVLRSWPSGTPITIATYAAQMISVGDNTAADALAWVVGAPATARYASRNSLFSPRELCALMDKVADLPLMSINPGVADPAKFARVAFIGGTEPGALSFVTAVVTKSGSHACLALTVNNLKQAINENSVSLPYDAMLDAIAR